MCARSGVLAKQEKDGADETRAMKNACLRLACTKTHNYYSCVVNRQVTKWITENLLKKGNLQTLTPQTSEPQRMSSVFVFVLVFARLSTLPECLFSNGLLNAAS